MPKNFNFGASVKLSRPTANNSNDNKLVKNQNEEIKEVVEEGKINTEAEKENTSNEKPVEPSVDSNLKPAPETRLKQSLKEETRLNGFRLPVGLDHLLESYAYHEGVNKTDLVIEALKQYFKNKKVQLIPIKKRKKR